MFDIAHKKITIIGGKRSGLALSQLILRRQGIPRISEHGEAKSMDVAFMDWVKDNRVETQFGGHTKEFILESDLLVLSPGVRFDAPPVLWAKENNIPVLGEIEFAYQFCDKPVIAVTGSNGKTTTVNLITKVLEAAGKRPRLCGNVGMPFSSFVLDLGNIDYIVLEVSSFQLESMIEKQAQTHWKLRGFKPLVGVILNFSQNHLDRHKDLQEYFDAKKRLFLNQGPSDFAVLNFNDVRLKDLAKQLPSKVMFFDSPEQKKETGLSNPNQLAVAAVAEILGIKEETYKKVFEDFQGVEHRLELVRVIDGVDYVNDSKATTAEASRWALNSIEKPIFMICGGRDKHIDFSVLKELVQKKVKKMYAIGEARQKLKNTFQDIVSVDECETLEDAVARSRKESRGGDCVVLSPMCASFDMFRDYEHRGKVFKEIVRKLN